jgi:hypothetical protein
MTHSIGMHSTGNPFSWRFGNAPTPLLAGLLLKEGKGLCQDGLIGHYYPSTCASAASAWGSQNAMSMVRYSAMAVDSAVRACSDCPALAYRVPRPRWQ